jgi:threonine/homoserine/homoserine lactone efflux protein
MLDYNYWLLFISAAVALNVAPGPDVLYIVTKTISGGKGIGVAAMLGICTGALIHVVVAAIGLSAVLMTSAVAFTVVKCTGACYLLYLAYQSFLSPGASSEIDNELKAPQSALKAFKEGILIDVLNPKVAIFFLAFLPQFVREGYGSTPFQLLYLGVAVILIALIIETVYILFASKVSERIRNSRAISVYLDRIVGAVFLLLGLKLASSVNT